MGNLAKTKTATPPSQRKSSNSNALERIQNALERRQDKMSRQLKRFGISVEDQIGAVVALANSNYALQTATRSSIVSAVYQANQMGLYLHPALKHAYLVPFRPKKGKPFEAQLVIDARGYIHKAVKTGMIKAAHVELVYEQDEFDYGVRVVGVHDKSFLAWTPFEGDPAKRGAITHVFVLFTMPDDSAKWRVMPISRIEKIRKNSPAVRSGKTTPWDTHYEEMCSKTAIKWAFKLIPMTIEVSEMLQQEDVLEGYIDEDVIDIEETNEPEDENEEEEEEGSEEEEEEEQGEEQEDEPEEEEQEEEHTDESPKPTSRQDRLRARLDEV